MWFIVFLFIVLLLSLIVHPPAPHDTLMIHPSEIDTGDLLLFRHDANVLPYSHVGVAWRDQCSNRLYVYESINIGDYKPKPEVGGVVLFPFNERIGIYDGDVVCRKLPKEVRTPELRQRIKSHIESNLGKKFDMSSPVGIIKRWVKGMPPIEGKLCSELAAELLSETGMVHNISNRTKLPIFMSTRYEWFYDMPHEPERWVDRSELPGSIRQVPAMRPS